MQQSTSDSSDSEAEPAKRTLLDSYRLFYEDLPFKPGYWEHYSPPRFVKPNHSQT